MLLLFGQVGKAETQHDEIMMTGCDFMSKPKHANPDIKIDSNWMY